MFIMSMNVDFPSCLSKALIAGLLVLNIFSIQGQDTLYFNLSSPHSAVVTHLQNLQGESYHPEVAAQVFNQELVSKERARKLAVKLKQIWDGEGHFIAVEDIPNNPQHIDSLSGRHKYVVVSKYPQIFLVKYGNRWQYAESSYSAIDRLHNTVYPFGADFLVNLFPESAHKQFLGLQLWQYLGVLLLLVFGWLVFQLFTLIFKKILANVVHRLGYQDQFDAFIRPIAKPFSLIVAILLILAVLPLLQLPVNVSRYFFVGLKIVIPVLGVIIFYVLADMLSLYLAKMASLTESTMDDQLIPIVRRSLKLFVILVGALFLLHNLDINITALLAGLSIGGLAVALAAQDTLKNLFGSVMIFLDRPFQIGDWISGDGFDGTVEEVGFRSTRIRTFSNSLVSIPNGRLSDLTIDNHGLRTFRRFKTYLALTYDTAPASIEAFVSGVHKLIEQHPHTRKDFFEVRLNQLGDFSLNVLLYVFFEVPDWSAELKARHEVLLQILELADSLQVRFAFPTQTLHMETFPGELPLTPGSEEDMSILKQKLDQYFQKNPE